MQIWLARARLLIATLWAGSLWTVGYLAAPTLFITLHDRVLAGTIAGNLFGVQAWLSIFCAVVLIALLKGAADEFDVTARKRLFAIVIGMFVCTLTVHFGFQPLMAGLREAAGSSGVMASQAAMQFGLLHGVASLIYLMQSLLAVALIVRIR